LQFSKNDVGKEFRFSYALSMLSLTHFLSLHIISRELPKLSVV
jgi:hypothetical protein